MNTHHSSEVDCRTGHAEQDGAAPPVAPVNSRKALTVAAIVLLGAASLAGVGILSRVHEAKVLAERTAEQAAPTVSIAPARAGAPSTDLILPGNVTALTDSPVYARTSGYLTRWHFDLGSHVRKGALLAEIAAPEVDRQLQQGEADLATAQANAKNAQTQAERYSGLLQTNAVARQDADAYGNQAAATAAAVRSAQANVQRLRELQSYEKIYAPFDGVITARTVDTGQLIDAGAGKELFHMQATESLRVYVSLPQMYSASIKKGESVGLTFAEHQGKTYAGTLTRTAAAMDPASRTLLVEVDVVNRNEELLPGSLAQAHFKLPAPTHTFVVPVAAVLFRKEGLRVVTVDKDSVAHLTPVVIGEDDGTVIQVVSGIGSEDAVIQDPPESIVEGQKVRVVQTESNGGGR